MPELPKYNYNQILHLLSNEMPGSSTEALKESLLAIDENRDGNIDFLDAAWSCDEITLQLAFRHLGISPEFDITPNYFRFTNQFEEFQLPPLNLINKENECSQGPITNTAAQDLADTYVGVCSFLENDSKVNDDNIFFRHANPYCLQVQESDQNSVSNIGIQPHTEEKFGATNIESEIIRIKKKDPNEYIQAINREYEKVLANDNLNDADRLNQLEHWESVMENPIEPPENYIMTEELLNIEEDL